jgi:hypothetical protein
MYNLGQVIYHVPTERVILFAGVDVQDDIVATICYDEALQLLAGIDLKDTVVLRNGRTGNIALGALHMAEHLGTMSIKEDAKVYAIQKLRETALKVKVGLLIPQVEKVEETVV